MNSHSYGQQTRKSKRRRPASQQQVNKNYKKQTTKTSKKEVTKPAESFASQKYKEIQFSYSLINDSFKLRSEGNLGSLRAQMQSLNFTYSFFRPGQNIKFLYNYGFSVGIGKLKGIAEPFGEEADGVTLITASFIYGIDFRNSYRTRIGVFFPLTIRNISFNLPDEIEVSKRNEPFSLGVGARYINAISARSAITLAYSYQYFWQSGTWDLSWQYRL